jgi:hypothetical protein
LPFSIEIFSCGCHSPGRLEIDCFSPPNLIAVGGGDIQGNERHPQWLFAGALNNVYCAPLKIKKGSTHSSAKVNRKASSDISIVCVLCAVCVCVYTHPCQQQIITRELIPNFSLDTLAPMDGWILHIHFSFSFSPLIVRRWSF